MKLSLMYPKVSVLIAIIFFLACTKPSDPVDPVIPPSVPPIDTTLKPPPPPAPVVRGLNRWQCEINGKLYSGNVDTSYLAPFVQTNAHPDTNFVVVGTTDAKDANIYFNVRVNRYYYPETSRRNNRFMMSFDTLTSRFAQSDWDYNEDLTMQVDTLRFESVSATFSGKIRLKRTGSDLYDKYYSVTKGKVSATFGQGNSEPKLYSFDATGSPGSSPHHGGYFHTGRMLANTVLLYGMDLNGPSVAPMMIAIRTGGVIKPGVYRSVDGNLHISCLERFIKITDTIGDGVMTIESVIGNVISGTFSGNTIYNNVITNGRFQCRIQDYQPEPDAASRWKMNLDQNTRFELFAGNTTKATLTTFGELTTLTINGNSDNGTSSFKLELTRTQIIPGEYSVNPSMTSGILKTVEFTSAKLTENGWPNNFKLSDQYYVKIDLIDAGKVEGRIFLLTGPYGTINPSKDALKGSFNANF